MAEWEVLISITEVRNMKASVRGEIKWVNQDLAEAAKSIKMLKRKRALLKKELAQLEARRQVLVCAVRGAGNG